MTPARRKPGRGFSRLKEFAVLYLLNLLLLQIGIKNPIVRALFQASARALLAAFMRTKTYAKLRARLG